MKVVLAAVCETRLPKGPYAVGVVVVALPTRNIGLREAVLIVVGVEGGGADLDDVAVVVVCIGGGRGDPWIGR